MGAQEWGLQLRQGRPPRGGNGCREGGLGSKVGHGSMGGWGVMVSRQAEAQAEAQPSAAPAWLTPGRAHAALPSAAFHDPARQAYTRLSSSVFSLAPLRSLL